MESWKVETLSKSVCAHELGKNMKALDWGEGKSRKHGGHPQWGLLLPPFKWVSIVMPHVDHYREAVHVFTFLFNVVCSLMK